MVAVINEDIKGIIWDLDNTLYRFTDAFKFSCNKAAAKAALEIGFNKSYEETLEIAVKSSQDHHFSLYSFITDYGLDYNRLHVLFHDYFDEALIEPIDGVIDSVSQVNLPQVVLTNGSRRWAQRALIQIGGQHLFEDSKILCMEDVNMIPKARDVFGYQKALALLNINAENVVFIDDLDRNLDKAKQVQLQTALVHHSNPLDELPLFIDYQFNNPIDFIEELNLAA